MHAIRPIINSNIKLTYTLMQSPESFDHSFHLFHIARADVRYDLLLQLWLTGEEFLDELTVNETVGCVSGTSQRAECTEGIKRQVTQGIYLTGDDALEGHQEVLVFGVDQCEQVNGALNLEEKYNVSQLLVVWIWTISERHIRLP